MEKECVVTGCNTKLKTGFSFPIDRPEALKKWVAALEKHQKLPPNFELKFVCSAHFIKSDYLKGKKSKLNKRAVPSVFPTDCKVEEISGDEQRCPEIKVEQTEDENKVRPRRSTRVAAAVRLKNEEDGGSDSEPSDEYNPSLSESDGDRNSQDLNSNENQNPISDVDLSRCDSIFTFMEIDTDEPIDSDYEPVTETSIETLQEVLTKKAEDLQKKQKLLTSMEEMADNQQATILRLKAELADLMKVEAEEIKSEASPETTAAGSKKVVNPAAVKKVNDYTNLDLQMFAISLFYFSPKVYYYLASIMPYLPPKGVLVDWVKSGYALTLFPPGLIRKENFALE